MSTPQPNQERQNALRRLKKILALGQSSEPGEAAAALHQAQVLMEKFGLSAVDVDFASIEEASTALNSADLTRTESALIGIISAALGISVLISRFPRVHASKDRVRRPKASVIFIGESYKAQIAVYAFETLRRKMKKDLKSCLDDLLNRALPNKEQRKLFTLTTKQREAYAYAWCQAVRSKVQALAPEPSPAVQRYIEARVDDPSKTTPVRGAKPRKSKQPDLISAYMRGKGFRAGQDTQIHQAVHGQAGAQLQLA